MDRRKFLLSASTVGITGAGGCLSATACDEPSNHLYIENQLPGPQEIDVQVMKESGGFFADQTWTEIFREYVELSGEEYRIIEELYDEHGTYRTVAEQEIDHEVISNRETSDVDDCHDQSITIGISDRRIDILHGVPDHLPSETNSDS